MTLTLEQLEADRLAWSLKTFPKATRESSLIKAQHEIEEIKDAMIRNKSKEEKAEEYADSIMCIFDSAGRDHIYVQDIVKAYALKLEKNKNRTWVENPDHTYSHVKGENI